MNINNDIVDSLALKRYHEVIRDILQIHFPLLSINDIDECIRYSINKRYKEEKCTIHNNYNNRTTSEMTLIDLTNYIIEREPIITAWGVLWKKKGSCPNPLVNMIKGFMKNRGLLKDEMFKYPKGSAEFERYNLLQLLAKLDANGTYGVLGMYSCMYYNLHVAASVTSQGKSLVSTLGMFFEQFLANNVKFGSLNEVITFIHNVVKENRVRKYSDSILDRNITSQECFVKIAFTCGFEWIPTENELQIIWEIISNLSQNDLNRLYYKNNLYEFILNKRPLNMVKELLSKLNEPYLNPNKCPKEIEVELNVFTDILKEFVYYGYHIIDRIDRMDNMIKCVTALSDTDSTIVSFDPWYNCILEQVKNMDLNITKYAVDAVSFADKEVIDIVEWIEPEIEYDFFNEKTIEITRAINICTIIPQDNLRYSIINILAYAVDKMVNDYLKSYCKLSNSSTDVNGEELDCLIIAKNEFLFKRALLTDYKKNYATLQEIQEGNIVPKDKQIDIKGLPMRKSSLNKNTREALKRILYEDVLSADNIDRIKVIKDLAILEDKIYKSLQNGERDYYKPLVIKSIHSYQDPTRIQGIKAAVAWNELSDGNNIIDLRERNSIDIVKVNITYESAQKIRFENPELYDKIISIVGDEDGNADNDYKNYFKGKINVIAIPNDTEVPNWIKEFIDYTTIINDNLKNFPLESIGIKRQGKDSINYTNIVKI